MFRDAAQRVAVCRALLGRVDLASFWCGSGWTHAGAQLVNSGGEGLLPAQAAMLTLVDDFWEVRTTTTLVELVDNLPSPVLAAVGRLLQAFASGPTGLDLWLEEDLQMRRTEQARGDVLAVPPDDTPGPGAAGGTECPRATAGAGGTDACMSR